MIWTRTAILAALPVAAVAVVAGWVSYSHIYTLGLRAGQDNTNSHLLPVAIDGLIVAGSAVLAAGARIGWLAVVPGVVATLYANLESGLPHGGMAAVVATWPAVAFSLASFVLERWLKSQIGQPGRNGQSEALTTDTAAELPPADEQAPATCGHDLTGPAERVVVEAYLHGRDCLGNAPSQRSLSATYGLHRTKVAALVGPLNGREPESGEAALHDIRSHG
jgi:hypothetical protein